MMNTCLLAQSAQNLQSLFFQDNQSSLVILELWNTWSSGMPKKSVIPCSARLPKELIKEELISSAGTGIYQLFSGCRPENIIYSGAVKKIRINLSKPAYEYFCVLERCKNFKSRNDIFLKALSYIAESPAWLRQTKI